MNYNTIIKARLSPEQEKKVKEYVRSNEVTTSDLIRQAIDQYLEPSKPKLEDGLTDSIRDRLEEYRREEIEYIGVDDINLIDSPLSMVLNYWMDKYLEKKGY